MTNQQTLVPDFSNYGYNIIRQLGSNLEKSDLTWLAITNSSKVSVVIKQFCFATQNSTWAGYQAYQQEIDLLKKLDHPGIPKYLSSFETENGFCFVREYIEGVSLAEQKIIDEKKIKIIAAKTLEILQYLQQQQPPILHLNLTPDNILLDGNFNVYLIDFSFAQKTNHELQTNYFKIENAEFIAPEQVKTPCPASDIYSLGKSLISVIEDNNSQKSEKKLTLSQLDIGFQEWLITMTETELSNRYTDAENALKALKSHSWDEIDTVINLPENMAISQSKFSLSIVTMAILGFAIAVGFQTTQQVTETSLINITIAVMGAIIIYLTQSASATLVTNDKAEKKQAIAVAISVPILLTIITGIIFGRGEAVAMSLATLIAQTANLGSVLRQKLPFSQPENILKGIALLIAIAIGLILEIVIS